MKNVDKIKLFAFDVDGTLTPGTLIFGSAGEVYKEFHVHDGMALGLLHRMGYTTVFLTGRKSEIV
ncbi:MAG: 3-deoxy-D-manno-octulosonate 8-phosphate phosphatase, partial [Dialister sp.]|nr:3-deoxy-D-manno-octulosonate 8-phosphate phosphatase [Dialister sp.]